MTDEWIFFTGWQWGVFRAPKKRGGAELIERIGDYGRANSGQIIYTAPDQKNIYWFYYEPAPTEFATKLYDFELATETLNAIDVPFPTQAQIPPNISEVIALDDRVYLASSACLRLGFMLRDSYEIKLFEQENGVNPGGSTQHLITSTHFYCAAPRGDTFGNAVWRMPFEGGPIELYTEFDQWVYGMVDRGDRILVALTDDFVYINKSNPMDREVVGTTDYISDSEFNFDQRTGTMYWLSRYGPDGLVSYGVDDLQLNRIPLAQEARPNNGADQDDEYIYFGDRNPDRRMIARIRKPF